MRVTQKEIDVDVTLAAGAEAEVSGALSLGGGHETP